MKPALRVLTTPLCLLTLLACPEQVVVRDIPAVCGDGAVDADEICDDGNNEQLDACTGVCQPARCGDGLTRTDSALGDEGYEACDDGNSVDSDGCLNSCQLAACGDGVIRTDLPEGHLSFEACDDGN
ncbi:MAG: DUF4215 domain-containing protein, partial [Myxococcota bacterium]|nr:DUF4215 domain-containing protein [Myxococcota bacterium]